MDAGAILARRVQRTASELTYVNTLAVRDRVTIDFVWYPGAANFADSLVDPFVVDHPRTGARREISYTWARDGKTAVTRVMNNGRITIPLPEGSRGTLTAFGTSWQITRVAAGVNMTAVNQLRGVQERLNRLGYHVRRPGAKAAGTDNVLGATTEHAVLCFQTDYRPTGAAGAPVNRLQVRGEWTNNAAAQYQTNLNSYTNAPPAANPSAADSANLQAALVAYVGA